VQENGVRLRLVGWLSFYIKVMNFCTKLLCVVLTLVWTIKLSIKSGKDGTGTPCLVTKGMRFF